MQFARNGAGTYEAARVRELADGRLAVRVRVSYPTGDDVGLPDNLVIECIRLILDEPTDASRVVGWGGRRPRELPGDFAVSSSEARKCPAEKVSLGRR